MLPNFVAVGFPRSGTTWMYNILSKHPDVFLSYKKELYFFDKNFQKGLDWYKTYFRDYQGQPLVGDITPTYIHDPSSAQRIREALSDPKIIISLRHPLDRLFSEYQKNSQGLNLNRSFREDANEDHLRNRMYHPLVKAFFEQFPRDRIHVMLFEEMREKPLREMVKILGFLGLETSGFLAEHESMIVQRHNVSSIPKSTLFYSLLSKAGNRLTKFNFPLLDKSVIRVRKTLKPLMLKRGGTRQAMVPSDEDRAYIESKYRDDVKALSSLLGIDLLAFWGFTS